MTTVPSFQSSILLSNDQPTLHNESKIAARYFNYFFEARKELPITKALTQKGLIKINEENPIESFRDGLLLLAFVKIAIRNDVIFDIDGKKLENFRIVMQAAGALLTRNIFLESVIGKDSYLLDFVFELICAHEVSKINIESCPLISMAFKSQIEKFERNTGYDLIIKWVNFMLKSTAQVSYLATDFSDGKIYAKIMKIIDPKFNPGDVDTTPSSALISSVLKFASESYSFPDIFTPEQLSMKSKFTHSLFLSLFIQLRVEKGTEAIKDVINEAINQEAKSKETFEEQCYRVWINTILNKQKEDFILPHQLFSRLTNGDILSDIVRLLCPDKIDESKLIRHPPNMMQYYANLSYILDLCKNVLGLLLVGIDATNIRDGNKNVTLSLLMQLMRKYYTYFYLTKRGEHDVLTIEWLINWGNKKAGTNIKNIKEASDALFFLKIEEAIQTKCVNWKLIKQPAKTKDDFSSNNQMCLNTAWKIGVKLYLPYEPDSIVSNSEFYSFMLLAALYFRSIETTETVAEVKVEEPEAPKITRIPFDAIVIGHGHVAIQAAYELGIEGMKVAMLQDTYDIGITPADYITPLDFSCANKMSQGCCGEKCNDGNCMKDYRAKCQQISQLSCTNLEGKLKSAKVELFTSEFEFISEKEIKMGNTILETKYLIACKRPEMPSILTKFGYNGWIRSRQYLQSDAMMKSIMVINGSTPMGWQISTIAASMGVEVYFVNPELCINNLDGDIKVLMMRRLEELHIKSVDANEIKGMEKIESNTKITLNSGEFTVNCVVDCSVACVETRKENKFTAVKDKMKCDEQMRPVLDACFATSIEGVFIINLALPLGACLKIAENIAKNISHKESKKLDLTNCPLVMMTIPPVFKIGMSEEEAINNPNKTPYKVFRMSYYPVHQLLNPFKQPMIIKFIATQPNDLIVGAQGIGEQTMEICQSLSLAMQLGCKVEDLQRSYTLTELHASFNEIN